MTVRSFVEFVRADTTARDMKIEEHYAPDLPRIRADQDAIRQMTFNLLSNAIKFTPVGGRIAVRIVMRNDCVNLSVSDTGIGISAEDIPKVLEPFSQIEDKIGRASCRERVCQYV